MAIEIKICGLSTPATLEAALIAGANMVGLNFYAASPRFVTLAEAAALAAIARGRTTIVALVVDADDDALAALKTAVAPNTLQLHGKETLQRVADIRTRFALPVMKAIGVSDAADIALARRYVGIADYLLLDAKPPRKADALPGGNGLAFDWQLVSDLDPPLPFMLSGGLDAGNVGAAMRLVRPAGVDVSSGVESAPGRKDETKIRAFIAAARAADTEGRR